jgi:hypothetical protein
MVQIPDEIFFQSTLTIGTVYYYVSDEIQSDEPHYHIVIHKTKSEIVILGLTTTQIDKRISFLEKNQLPESTLIFIEPDENNGLKKTSLVDCNSSIFQETKNSLKNIRQEKDIKVKGMIKNSQIEQLRQGIIDSPMIPQEFKELLCL